MIVRSLLLLTFASSAAIFTGCSSGDRNLEVSGTVTFKGTPVPMGTILFEPDAAKGNKGRGVMAEIKDGAYRSRPGQGVVGGPHVVRIVGFDGKGDARGESMRGSPLFSEQVRHVDLSQSSRSIQDFDITTK